MPREKRDRIERFDELHGFLHQSMISAENVARLDTLTGHEDHPVAELAAQILEIARVLPGKRNRWLRLVRYDRPLFNRAVELFGVEFFEDLLAGYGDFESPLWHILDQCRVTPRRTARACDCGSTVTGPARPDVGLAKEPLSGGPEHPGV